MFNWLHRLLGGKRTPQDTQWPRPLPQMTLGQDPDAYRCPMPDAAQKAAANAFLAKHGLSLDSKLSDGPATQDRPKATLKPEGPRSARSLAVSKGNRTRAANRQARIAAEQEAADMRRWEEARASHGNLKTLLEESNRLEDAK